MIITAIFINKEYFEKNMNTRQAKRIIAYNRVPQDRVGQEALIREMGYTKLRGKKKIANCSDAQIYSVAANLYRRADKVLIEASCEIQKDHLTIDNVTNDNRALYCEVLNLSPKEGSEISLGDLEKMICG